MSIPTSNQGLEALRSTLEANRTLSDEFKRVLTTHALHAASYAYIEGYEAGQCDAGAHSHALPDIEPESTHAVVKATQSINPSAEAERLRARMLDLEPYSPTDTEGH